MPWQRIRLAIFSAAAALAAITAAIDAFSGQSAPAGFVLREPLTAEGPAESRQAAGLPPCPGSAVQRPLSESYFCSQFLDNSDVSSVHAATLAELPGGGIGAWWYGGTEEGARDVSIYFSRYSHETGTFSAATVVATREQLSSQLGRYIKKLGNPAAVLDQNERLWLFFVSVSVGGWAGSALNFMVSDDGGGTWSPAKRLVTSPFFNISTLVRSPPVPLDSGELMIPVYHEFIGKFSEILVIGSDGSVKDKRRITWGSDAVQPSLAPLSSGQAAIVMRSKSDTKPFVHFSSTEDGGQSFHPVRTIDLPSADNAVTAAKFGQDRIWIVYNRDTAGRRALSIAVSAADGTGTRRIADLENALDHPGWREFSYPAVITDRRGLHHAAWTHDRKQIRHAVFSNGWLTGRPEAGPVTP